MSWKIFVKDPAMKPLEFDSKEIRDSGFVKVWNTDEEGYGEKDVLYFPSWRVVQIERVED